MCGSPNLATKGLGPPDRRRASSTRVVFPTPRCPETRTVALGRCRRIATRRATSASRPTNPAPDDRGSLNPGLSLSRRDVGMTTSIKGGYDKSPETALTSNPSSATGALMNGHGLEIKPSGPLVFAAVEPRVTPCAHSSSGTGATCCSTLNAHGVSSRPGVSGLRRAKGDGAPVLE